MQAAEIINNTKGDYHMATSVTYKCGMCGGPCHVEVGATVFECDYCGTQQPVPKLDDERRANMYDRANHFRRNNEFDKAMGIYEQILNEDITDSVAYWSLVLCRYGIVYVEDPASHKRIPTVNRAQFTSIFDDDNYRSALQYADSYQRMVYEEEAKTINEIQKGILAISQNEEPFDVFICYKESDSYGRRTPDSVLAQDLYYQLTNEGFKVFFARITLEDKLGSAYEPYIFAALNSAKVMVALGTSPDYFKAVWVKNEWSRFLSLIKQGQKKILIPAYKDMDPYDLPDEFSHLQAQDMSKLGFMQDLIRGIKKMLQVEAVPATTIIKETVVPGSPVGGVNTAPLLKRVFMFLEDGEWASANEYCEKVLDIDPECAEAYLGKLMAELRIKTREALKDCAEPFDDRNNYQKVLRFADDELKAMLTGCTEYIEERHREASYLRANMAMQEASIEAAYKAVAQMFKSLGDYKNSRSLSKECYAKAETARLDRIYNDAKNAMKSGAYKEAQKIFEEICAYRDSAELAKQCKNAIQRLAKKTAQRRKLHRLFVAGVFSCILLFVFFIGTDGRVFLTPSMYRQAEELFDSGKYEEAGAILMDLNNRYKDVVQLKYEIAKFTKESNSKLAYSLLITIPEYENSWFLANELYRKHSNKW
ncbi:MAG: toll/interleukin-1 receptor domain-containing protein [Clostridia bacterium]|nr:toll/interleukin-1 receptor domain-containing protein [Clostridia bacterium]